MAKRNVALRFFTAWLVAAVASLTACVLIAVFARFIMALAHFITKFW